MTAARRRRGVTASNARFPLFLATTNCLDFLLLVAGPDRSQTVPNLTYLRRELIVSSLYGCTSIDTERYCSAPRSSTHYSRSNRLYVVDYYNDFRIHI